MRGAVVEDPDRHVLRVLGDRRGSRSGDVGNGDQG